MNMNPKFDFKDGVVTYENLFCLLENPNTSPDEFKLSEDLLQISFF